MSDFYDKITVDQLKEQADIRTCIPGADRTKATSYVPCPKCGKAGKGKGLCVTVNNNVKIHQKIIQKYTT